MYKKSKATHLIDDLINADLSRRNVHKTMATAGLGKAIGGRAKASSSQSPALLLLHG